MLFVNELLSQIPNVRMFFASPNYLVAYALLIAFFLQVIEIHNGQRALTLEVHNHSPDKHLLCANQTSVYHHVNHTILQYQLYLSAHSQPKMFSHHPIDNHLLQSFFQLNYAPDWFDHDTAMYLLLKNE